jgi:hypothetical protein
LALLIQVFSLLDGLNQGLGIIIPNILFIKGWNSTQEPLYLHLFIFYKPNIL